MTPAVPHISVLMPTHNRADVVGFAIRSVLAQTEPDFELLVVGDGCTDATADIVTSFDDARIQWFDLPKAEGYGHANRNIVMRQAKGEIVAFAAHDDLLFPDHLERMCGLFANGTVDWAYSRPLWVDYDGLMVPGATDLRLDDQRNTFLTAHNTIPGTNVVYLRSVHDEIGWYRESGAPGGDWDLWKRMVGRPGAQIAYQPEPTAVHTRANWRTDAVWSPPPVSRWVEFARETAWPGPLRVPVGNEQLAQAALWEQISTGGAAWVSEVRSAVHEAVELLAIHGAERLGGIERDLRSARGELARSEARQARALGPRGRRLLLKLRGNPLLDEDWYETNNTDVAPGGARRHWKTVGARELRDPNPDFSTQAYLERYPDVRESGMDPLDHFFVYGLVEGRNAKPWA